MKTFLTHCSIAFVLFLVTVSTQANDEVHYIGFNKFVSEKKAQSGAAFDDYIRQLLPIMARYDMTAGVFDAVHGGSDDLSADVVTFGTAKSMESMQAFFQDAELQAIFPILLGALSSHQVIFTSGPMALGGKQQDPTLLSLTWVQGDPDKGLSELNDINDRLSPVFAKYGARQIAQSTGVMSNRGLGAEVEQTTPPQLLELWSISDAHGLFDDPQVQSTEKEAKPLISRSESFWLQHRDIK
jgi:hypothetical protein